MKPRKSDSLLRTYFQFPKHERRGIVLLILLITGVSFLPALYARLREKPEPYQITLLESAVAQLENNPGIAVQAFRNNSEPIRFPQKRAQNVYSKNESKRNPAQPVPRVVEMNTADSLAIVSLYRIGPALTHRILEYREGLGGFLNLEQLSEVWGFDEDLLFDLNGKIRVDAAKVRRMELNSVASDRLRLHPYFKYKLSNAIVNYRKQHGPFQSLSDLKKIVLVNDSVYDRITKYLYLEN